MTTLHERVDPAQIYAAGLRGEACHLVDASGSVSVLPVPHWQSAATGSDLALLERCDGPTLDVGCGPGRMSRSLLERGVPALGIDIVAEAVTQARRRGVPALLLDVFGPVPATGRWDHVLLADGNIGIGGDPRTLLRRCAELLGPGGSVVTDLAPHGSGVRRHQVRLTCGATVSRPFAWAHVGAESVAALAAAAGLVLRDLVEVDQRCFAVLGRQ